MSKRILHLFTRTPLHVGAGASVGAIDQPIVRERHTGFPVIPASSLKGTFADVWNDGLLDETNDRGETKKVRVTKDGGVSDAAWLFGSDSDKHASAGALQFSEARLLAFPIRSAKGSFAWITCPLMLQRAARDGVISAALLDGLTEPGDGQALFEVGETGKLNIRNALVLEEYAFGHREWSGLPAICKALADLMPTDPVWQEVTHRLVVLANGMLSYFVKNACEVAQHVRISDETGTAADGALFNQENVPGESMFYSILHGVDERRASRGDGLRRNASTALKTFAEKTDGGIFQFGGDASTGLGYCTVTLSHEKES